MNRSPRTRFLVAVATGNALAIGSYPEFRYRLTHRNIYLSFVFGTAMTATTWAAASAENASDKPPS